MRIKHIGLVSSSEDKSDLFYKNLLGLKKLGTRSVPASLMGRIFDINTECKIVNYADDVLFFEIFIFPESAIQTRRIDHVCLEVDRLQPFLDHCRKLNIHILQIPKDDGTDLIFIKDFDGNRFEIKKS